jgi:arginyl-tRNA synthetase
MKEAGLEGEVTASQVTAEAPPKKELGDLGFPMFGYAKLLRKSPPQIALLVAGALEDTRDDRAADDAPAAGSFRAEGPYLNVSLDRAAAASSLLRHILREENFKRPGTLAGSRVMVEYSSPNTNKPLHLGHLRNDVLGESISRILEACGAEVRRVCIINDRGIHICKSMLAYQKFGGGKTPESERVKSDRFVGDWYVKFNDMSRADTNAESEAQELLRRWEAGDSETVNLWKTMNAWAVEGMKKTWNRTGCRFDKFYFESQTYLLGKDEVLKGLEKGLFYKQDDGAVVVDLSAEKLDKKVLLRKDGTSIYITQDIGTAIFRHNDWPFDRLVFVVGSEQQYHFKVLFTILARLGFGWAENLYHLSYGMVNLPEGRMKSREGTVVDADDLIDSLKDMALEEIREKERTGEVGDPEEVAEKIALGALHYYLLQVSAAKDMLFNPKESLSFNGNTGPYLQYMGARISALLRKAALPRGASLRGNTDSNSGKTVPPDGGSFKAELLTGDQEWELVKTLADYPGAVASAAAGMDPSVLAAYLYELSRAFSRFYHDCPILNAESADLAAARLALSRAVLSVLRHALDLVCIPFLEVM